MSETASEFLARFESQLSRPFTIGLPPREYSPNFGTPVINTDDITARWLVTQHVANDMNPSLTCYYGHQW